MTYIIVSARLRYFCSSGEPMGEITTPMKVLFLPSHSTHFLRLSLRRTRRNDSAEKGHEGVTPNVIDGKRAAVINKSKRPRDLHERLGPGSLTSNPRRRWASPIGPSAFTSLKTVRFLLLLTRSETQTEPVLPSAFPVNCKHFSSATS